MVKLAPVRRKPAADKTVSSRPLHQEEEELDEGILPEYTKEELLILKGSYKNAVPEGLAFTTQVPWNKASTTTPAAPPSKSLHKLADLEPKWTRMETSGTEKVMRQLTGILNKLTADKFESLCSKFLQVVDSECSSIMQLEQVVSLLHEKAISEVNFVEMYAKLCEVLSKSSLSFTDAHAKRRTFLQVLLDEAQNHFESSISVSRELDEERHEGDDEAAAQVRMKVKKRLLGQMKFIGELYKKRLVSFKIVSFILSYLLRDSSDPCMTELECASFLLSTCGKTLESDPEIKSSSRGKSSLMSQWVNSLEKFSKANIPTRVKFILLSTLELRKNRWVSRKQEEAVPANRGSESREVKTGFLEHDARGLLSRRTGIKRLRGRFDDISAIEVVFTPIAPRHELESQVEAIANDLTEEDLAEFVPGRYPDQVAQKVRSALSEFVTSHDEKEAFFCLEEIKASKLVKNCAFVHFTIMSSLEQNKESDLKALAKLVCAGLQRKLFSFDNIFQG
jgi:hypothetical protein